MLNKKIRELIVPIFLFISFGVLYIHNLSPSVYGGDVGDFVTAAAVGGVAHAPGYPIFIFLGFLLIHALPFFTPAFAMGLLSVAAGVGGIVVCYYLIVLLTKSRLSAALTAILVGFSYLYWFYAEIAEIFALHSFLILLLFYFSFAFDKTKKKKWLYWFSFAFGVATVTHQTIALFIPSYLLILFPTSGKVKDKSKKTYMFSFRKAIYSFKTPFGWLKKQPARLKKLRRKISKEHTQSFFIAVGLCILPGLSYIYVFIASSHNPVINWDNVHDLHSFLQLLLRKDYGTFTAGLFAQPIWAQRMVILKTYLFTILTQLTIPTIAVSVVGLIAMWVHSKRYTVALLLAFFISGPLFIAYAGFPLAGNFFLGVYERFFTMSTLPVLILFGYGIYTLAKGFASYFDRPFYFVLLHVLFLLIPLQLFFYNFPKTDLSNVWVGDTMSMDFLTPLPKGSLLLMGGDTQLFNTWYIHYARKIRPDIRLVNLSLASTDPFIKQEEDQVKKANPHIKGNELVAQTLKEMAKKIPVYSFEQIQAPGMVTLPWVPTGMVYKLSADAKPQSKDAYLHDVEATIRQIHIPNSTAKNYRNLTIADIPQTYAKAMWAVGTYFQITYKDVDNAIVYYKKAIAIDPTFENAYTTIGLIYLINKNNCALAEENFNASIAQAPYGELPYFLLYTTYTECYHDKTKANAVIAQFKNEFHEDFFQELAGTLKTLKK